MAVTLHEANRLRPVVTIAQTLADGAVGTEHLLGGTLCDPRVRRVLDAYDLTTVALHAVLRHRAGRRDTPDGAQEAIDRCVAERTDPEPADLLSAILADPDSHAVAVLRDCDVDADAVRRALRTGQVPVRQDRLPADLRPVRDRMIGRDRYRGSGLRDYVLSAIVRVRINWAESPVLWAQLEADVIAKARGGRKQTDDVLLAMLTTYEVASAYPHLVGDAGPRYDGVRGLVAAGLDRHRVAAWDGAGRDQVPMKARLKGADAPPDTAALLRVLVGHPGNRAARLLDSEGISPMPS